MSYTLFDAILALAGTLRESYAGAADSGTTTNVTDSRFHGDNTFFHEGTLLHIGKKDAREIVGVTTTSSLIAFTGAFSTSVTAGDQFMLVPPTYPKQQIIIAINQALQAAGPMTQINEDIDVVADTLEYSLATEGISGIVRVETTSDTAAPYNYKRNAYWQEANGYLMFESGREPTAAGTALRIWYNDTHAWVSKMTDAISSSIHPDRLRWEALANLLRWRYHLTNKDEEGTAVALNEATTMAAMMQRQHPIARVNREIKLAEW